jgi:hypothetical protein
MSRIILHVGTHKTATTTLQDRLARNRRLLAERGIVFPAVGRSSGQHALVTPWIPLPERYRDSRPGREIWRSLIERHAPGADTLLLSSEEFSRVWPRAVDMRELGAMLSGFGRRTVICTLRNQLAYIQSLYLQVTKGGGQVAEFSQYLNRSLATNRAIGIALDYGALYDRLLTGFAPDEIVFVSYEAAARDPRGILGHILDRLGLPVAAAELAPLPAGDSNVSPEPLAAWAAGQIAAPRTAGRDLVALARDALAETFGAAAKSTLYSRPEAARVAAHFAPLNAAFEARYRAIDPDFALAPLALAPDLVYRGQLAPPFWIRFGQKLVARAAS